MINFQPVTNGFGLIVFAGDELSAAAVAQSFVLGSFVKQMIGSAAALADTAAGQSLFDVFIGHFDVDDPVDFHTHVIQCLCLDNGAGEAIQNESILAVIFVQALLDHADDYIVGDQSAGFHIGFGLQPHLGFILQCFTDDVSGTDSRNMQVITDHLSLCAFAGAGCAEKNQLHNHILL